MKPDGALVMGRKFAANLTSSILSGRTFLFGKKESKQRKTDMKPDGALVMGRKFAANPTSSILSGRTFLFGKKKVGKEKPLERPTLYRDAQNEASKL